MTIIDDTIQQRPQPLAPRLSCFFYKLGKRAQFATLNVLVISALILSACSSTDTTTGIPNIPVTLPSDYQQANPAAKPIQMPNSRWIPAAWAELPGWNEDKIGEVWQAWVQSCSLFSAQWAKECGQIIHLNKATENAKRQWMYDHLQPYRVESLQGKTDGLLTAYYEPVFEARRSADSTFKYPLYIAPIGLHPTRPYMTRKEIETTTRAQRELQAFAYLDNPLDVMILHIQGSGQLMLTEDDGTTHAVRAAFAATNNHRYHSIGRYLLDRKLITDGTWDGIRAWLKNNPNRVNEVLWSNPRYIFFREEAMTDPTLGPLGAQGVPLSYGRSIAVDKTSIPYGTPVWIASQDAAGAAPSIQKLVMAQDTGTAITGAVRADYFWGKGKEAGDQAGRTKQTLRVWTFLPKTDLPQTVQ